MAIKLYDGTFKGIAPQSFLTIVGDAAKALSSLTRYNQAGLQLLPRKSSRYINGNRTFYHPLSIVEFLTADYLNKGKLLPQKAKNNLAQLQSEDIFFGRINAYALALSDIKTDSAELNAFKMIISEERALLEDFVTRTDIVRGKQSSIRMTKVDVANLRHENLKVLVNYFDGSNEIAEAYLDWVTRLYIHVFLKVYRAILGKIDNKYYEHVTPSPLVTEKAEQQNYG